MTNCCCCMYVCHLGALSVRLMMRPSTSRADLLMVGTNETENGDISMDSFLISEKSWLVWLADVFGVT